MTTDYGMERAQAEYDAMEPPEGAECPKCDGPLYVDQTRYTYEAVCERETVCPACTMGSGPVVTGTGLWLEPHGFLGYCFCDCDEDRDCDKGKHTGCGYRFYSEHPDL
jgi:hypothetical protein